MRFAVLLLLFASLATASLGVTQSVAVGPGGQIVGTINVTNFGYDAEVLVVKMVDFKPLEPEPYVEPGDFYVPSKYVWNDTIKTSETKSFIYREDAGTTIGSFVIPSATAYLRDGSAYDSNEVPVTLVCDSNGVCDPSRTEDWFSCAADCKSGGADGYCDALADGVCDPDCSGADDVDCAKANTTELMDVETVIDGATLCGGAGLLIALVAGIVLIAAALGWFFVLRKR